MALERFLTSRAPRDHAESVSVAGRTPEMPAISRQKSPDQKIGRNQRNNWLVDAAPIEPVSPCNFGKCREILAKCREPPNLTELKAKNLRQLGPFLPTQEAGRPS